MEKIASLNKASAWPQWHSLFSAVLLFNPLNKDGSIATATVYNAVLESDSNGPMAFTKIRKSDMKLSVDIMKPISIADDMELTLWCHPKDGGMPMKMGTISKEGKTEISISKKEWQNMRNVGVLAISIEHKGDNKVREPTGKIILKGNLSSAG